MQGWLYLAIVLDVFSRRVVGWSMDSNRKTQLVCDAVSMAAANRGSQVVGVIHHSDHGSQYTSIAFTERLLDAGVDSSVGSVGDAYDNALAETVIGLYKTELIRRRGPWHHVEQVELATLDYVDWFNNRRILQSNNDLTPAELETAYYRHISDLAEAG